MYIISGKNQVSQWYSAVPLFMAIFNYRTWISEAKDSRINYFNLLWEEIY